jgi:F420-dependent oxidoreductase-like protein
MLTIERSRPGAKEETVSSNIAISAWAGADKRSVADVIDAVRGAAEAGFDGIWLPQTFSVDALTALAVAGGAVPSIAIGTAVVPIQGRHPIPLAQQALTAAQAAGPGRLTLGVGVTHAMVSEGFYGIPYRQAVALCREELHALQGLLGAERRSDLAGTYLTSRATLSLDVPAPSLVLAALGPQMLELAGTFTDGTVTWMTGPQTLGSRIVPTLSDAASRAGKPAPRVIAGLPVCVTDDVAAAREAVRPRIQNASAMPSYKRQLGQEGLDDLADLAIVGDADTVAARVLELAEIGVTELMADVFGTPAERAATTATLTGLRSQT